MNAKNANGVGTQLRRLLELMDGEVEAIYREEHPFYAPRYTPIMKALADGERLTIKAIAKRSSVSHSAASQTITRMVEHGLVALSAAEDKRSRIVELTEAGKALLPWLEGRWNATTRAAEALDRELPYPLSVLLSQAIAALEDEPFRARIRSHETQDEPA